MKNYLPLKSFQIPALLLLLSINIFSCKDNIEEPVSLTDIDNVDNPDEENEENEENNGFSIFEPSSDSKIIYVSSSDGDDNNDGLSAENPCKTIQEGIKKMRGGYPDHLLLKRGDIWTLGKHELDGLTSGRSKDEPTVFSYYGHSGPRPIIQGDVEVYRYDRSDGRKHIRWVGLHFYAYKKDPLNPNFDPKAKSPNLRFIGNFKDIHIEDVKFEFTEITIQAYDGRRPSDFRLKRNIFYGGYAYGSSYERGPRTSHIFAYGVDDGLLLEENVFDTGGWSPFVKGAGANLLSHNLYLQWDSDGNKTSFINNICTRASSHGIQMRSGGLAKDNFFARNAIGLLMGYNFKGREIPEGTIAHVFDNVISEGASMYSRGVDPCLADNNCTGAVWGIEMAINSNADYQAKDNIINLIAREDYYIHKNTRFSSNELKVKVPSGNVTKPGKSLNKNGFNDSKAIKEYPKSGNMVYGWKTDDEGADQNYLDPARTLADYAKSIGIGDRFDDFIQVVVNRPLGTWDTRLEARSINNFIREGFKKN